MAERGTSPRTAPAWDKLQAKADQIGQKTLREFFAEQPDRGSALAVEGAGLYLDYSKQRVDDEALALLSDLADQRGVREYFEAMFSGEHINVTEDRAVGHVFLRMPKGTSVMVDGADAVAQVHEVLDRMAEFSEKVRNGEWLGHTGKPIKTIVNIGIGGSDLGPVMAYQALRHYSRRDLDFRFVSNVDGTDLVEAVEGLDAEETLFIISSKTFTTQETMTNANSAREWALARLGDPAAVAKHFVAVSTSAERVSAFGIDTANMFGFWDWVGGRYSMDSAIGLSTMLAVGPEQFHEMLAGMHEMDEHARTAPWRENLPALMALLNVWNRNFLGTTSVAVLPYEQYLVRFPAYLQQMIMESNGKSVRLDGQPVDTDTSAVFWGEPGTNGQHSFYQLIHQGTTVIPSDFFFFRTPVNPLPAQDAPDHHDLLVANCIAQSSALAFGKTAEEVAAEGTPADLVNAKVMPGNRPSNTIVGEILDPRALGRLISLYEHSTFIQGVIWGLDSFDQWGVELGKVLARKLTPLLVDGTEVPGFDSSTYALAAKYRQ